MTPHVEEPIVATSDGAEVSDQKSNAETTGTETTLQYTQEELIKLRPAPVLPIGSIQYPIQTPEDTVIQAPTSGVAADTATDTEAEAEQQSELSGKPTADTAEKNRDVQELNEWTKLEKSPSIAEGAWGENGDAVNTAEDQVEAPNDATIAAGEGAKKKKKKKSSGKKKKPSPTGFEEFYADPPITPEEYAEEKEELYHPARAFAERIETCVQRYRARRKLDEERSNMFSKYLSLGGIDTTLKAFTGGVDNETMEDFDAPTIANIQATDVMFSGDDVGSKFYDPSAPHNWVVDFEGIAKAFLSYRAPYTFGINRQDVINKYCDVVKNFLNYVLMHSVCPEYTKDIIAAQKVCELAKTELPAINKLITTFPGNYHKALSIICSGYANNLYMDPATIDHLPTSADPNQYMSREHAHRTFRAAVALMATETQFSAVAKLAPDEAPTVVSAELRGFEVIRAVPPGEVLRRSFAGIRAADGRMDTIRPLGLLECRAWTHPYQDTPDLTPAEEKAQKRAAALAATTSPTTTLSTTGCETETETETFWVDEEILEHCFTGMKFIAVVHGLSVGIAYIDHLRLVYASFYTWVENERMVGWKVPRENEREAPCCDDEEVGDEEGGEGGDE